LLELAGRQTAVLSPSIRFNQTTIWFQRVNVRLAGSVPENGAAFSFAETNAMVGTMPHANVTWTRRGFDLRCSARDLWRKSSNGGEKASLDELTRIP
jgi:hypothetical protein